jgi:hypothetical protein
MNLSEPEILQTLMKWRIRVSAPRFTPTPVFPARPRPAASGSHSRPCAMNDTRRHDRDALRATAMLLGIACHAAQATLWLSAKAIQSRAQRQAQRPVQVERSDLWTAVTQGNADAVSSLLTAGADPNARHPQLGSTPLTGAGTSGSGKGAYSGTAPGVGDQHDWIRPALAGCARP